MDVEEDLFVLMAEQDLGVKFVVEAKYATITEGDTHARNV